MASTLARVLLRPAVVTVLAGLAAVATSSGCGKSNTELPTANVPGSDKIDEAAAGTVPSDVDPRKLLAEMVAAYQQAQSYEDAGELLMNYVDPSGQSHVSPVIPFSVALERPNKIRIHSLQASILGSGERLYASIDSLSGQVLVKPDPAKLSIADLESDSMLVEAMRGQIGVKMPQLELLLGDDPIRAIAGDGSPKLLPNAELNGETCHRVAVESPNGPSVLWISPASKLLLKFEFPSEAFATQFELAEASIAAIFKGAEVGAAIASDAFKFDLPDNARLLKRFLPPPPEAPSPLLGQKPKEFTFADFRGGDVTQQSLEGKVVVLDMWATWCGWCFEGFPNLQQVYDQFQDNDKVVILAVNTDEVTITDEKVREAFKEANITIPIVRDTQRAVNATFQVQGLPTMVILGTDGSIEDYHVGYDPGLATALPKKLERLLAGESTAKEELDAYQKALNEYQKEEAEAVVADAGGKLE
jgi:thiol-disulfide isomerase/thioredoxin